MSSSQLINLENQTMLNSIQRPLKVETIVKQAIKLTGATLLLTLAAPIIMADNIGVLAFYENDGGGRHDGILQQISSNAKKSELHCSTSGSY